MTMGMNGAAARKWLFGAGAAALVMGLAAFGLWIWVQKYRPVNLYIGPRTTVIDGPIRADGTVDYPAAVNAKWSEGVSPENNAFVIIAQLISPDAWDIPSVRERVFKKLGAAIPGDDAIYFIGIDTYARRQASEDPQWNEPAEAVGTETSGEPGTVAALEAKGVVVNDRFRALLEEHPVREVRRRWQDQWDRAQQSPWSEKEGALVSRWLEAQTAALERFREAAQRPRYWSPAVTPPDEHRYGTIVFWPQLNTVGSMGTALRARAMQRLYRGDLDGAVDDMLTLMRFSRHLYGAPSLNEQVEGWRLSLAATAVIEQLVIHEALTVGQARTLVKALVDLEDRASLSTAVDVSERYSALDSVQYIWSRVRSKQDVPGLTALSVRTFDPNRVMRQINDLYDRDVDAVAAGTHDKRIQQLQVNDDELRELIGDPSARRPVLLSRRNTETDIVMKKIVALAVARVGNNAVIMTDLTQTRERMARVALAIAGYHVEHGEYPASLDDLVPRWMDQVPEDPFDPAGSRVRYCIEHDHVKIYSVGVDVVDERYREDFTITWRR